MRHETRMRIQDEIFHQQMKILIIGEKTDQCHEIVEEVFQIYLKDAEFVTDSKEEKDFSYVICVDREIEPFHKKQYVVHLNTKTGKYKEIQKIIACGDWLSNLDSDQMS